MNSRCQKAAIKDCILKLTEDIEKMRHEITRQEFSPKKFDLKSKLHRQYLVASAYSTKNVCPLTLPNLFIQACQPPPVAMGSTLDAHPPIVLVNGLSLALPLQLSAASG